MKEKALELDLKRDKCHVCGNKVVVDLETKTQKCIYFGCGIKGINFSIPCILPGKSK